MSTPRKTAAVIGYGPGMGAAIARRFAAEGHRVIALARRPGPAEAGIERRQADAGSPESLAAALAGLEIDVLAYNAYRMTPVEGPSTLPPATAAEDLQVNVIGALAATQAVLPGMRARGTGAVIFTGGGLAFDPTFWLAAASLALGKAALRNLAFALHAELAPAGIHAGIVTIAGTVAPGTPFDPDRIAGAFWDLAQDAPGAFRPEIVFRG